MRDLFIEWGMVLVGLAFVLGFILGFNLGVDVVRTPYCPAEDSCYADYSNGTWYIIEGERP